MCIANYHFNVYLFFVAFLLELWIWWLKCSLSNCVECQPMPHCLPGYQSYYFLHMQTTHHQCMARVPAELQVNHLLIIGYCLSNAMLGIEQIYNYLSVCLSLCLSVCPQYHLSAIATAVFYGSSSNLELRSHMWQRTSSLMVMTPEVVNADAHQFTSFLVHF